MRGLSVVVALVLFLAPVADAARCTGSAYCRACSTCSSCGHCKAGGSCGVCAPRTPPKAPAVTPTPTPPPQRTTPVPQPPRPAREPAKPTPAVGKARVYFSPGGGATAAIVEQIGKARSFVKVQAYRMTSPQILLALTEAKKRGVSVEVILDKRQQSDRYSDATFLDNHQITVLIDHDHAIAHDKVMLIDGQVVITGSFNFSQAAETQNAENLLILEECPELAAAYQENYTRHVRHAKAYVRPSQPFEREVPTEDVEEQAAAEPDAAAEESSCCAEEAAAG